MAASILSRSKLHRCTSASRSTGGIFVTVIISNCFSAASVMVTVAVKVVTLVLMGCCRTGGSFVTVTVLGSGAGKLID